MHHVSTHDCEIGFDGLDFFYIDREEVLVEYGSPAIIGLKSEDHYGWLRLRIDGLDECASVTLTVLDWAFESQPNVPIQAGDLPEPSAGALVGLDLLALGAAGVRAQRRAAKNGSL